MTIPPLLVHRPGHGETVAALIADDCFAWSDAPVKRVTSTDTFVEYALRLEDAILPQIDDVKRPCEEIARFYSRHSRC
jgi:2-oxoisovalerate dehydrogenase E1 component